MKKEKEVRSKAESIFYYIVLGLGLLAIAIVLIVLIPKGGNKSELQKQYEYLPEENVYELVDFASVKNMISEEQDFYLFICNNELEEAEYYAYYVNELSQKCDIEKVFFINSSKLSKTDMGYFKQDLQLGKDIFDLPNILYFEDGIIIEQTYTIEREMYESCWEQLYAFFEKFYIIEEE